MNKEEIYFHNSSKASIGVEAELYTVSKENYNVPYIRQINEYNKNNDYTDIIQLYIQGLEKTVASIC